MIIETNRLILREYTMDDFNDLYQILSDPETMKHYPKPYDEKGTIRWLEWSINNYRQYGFGLWAIELKETNEFIGDCGITLQNIDNELLPEIGYHINKKHWKKGYAKEAGLAVLNWGFNNTNYEAFYSYMGKEYNPYAYQVHRLETYSDLYLRKVSQQEIARRVAEGSMPERKLVPLLEYHKN